jgi:YD repeat-containing protein
LKRPWEFHFGCSVSCHPAKSCKERICINLWVIKQVSVLTIYTFAVDATSTTILKYAYDADNRLTNRWSAQKGTTTYGYDTVGNLTSVTYPTNTPL